MGGEVLHLAGRIGVRFAAPAEDGAGEPGMGWPRSGCTDAHLALINAMPQVLTPLSASDVFVRGIYSLNDKPMWGSLMVETPGVEFVARNAVGVPVQCNHDTGWMSGRDALTVGRVFAGDVERDAEGVTWARLLAFFPATEANAELVQRMDGGAISENSVSIGFERTDCSICGGDIAECPHMPGEMYAGRECLGVVRGVSDFFETSLVWAGRAKDTRFFMAAGKVRELRDVTEMLKAKRERSEQGIERLLAKSELRHLYGR